MSTLRPFAIADMRQLRITFLAAAALVSITGAAGATPKDFVAGAGVYILEGATPDADVPVQFTLSASSGPLGQAVKGHFSGDVPGEPRVYGQVTCLVVVGNQAFITGVFTRGDSDHVGRLTAARAVDNGNPNGGVPDRVIFVDVPPEITPAFDLGLGGILLGGDGFVVRPQDFTIPPPGVPAGQDLTGCYFVPDAVPLLPVTQGDIVVHDEPEWQ